MVLLWFIFDEKKSTLSGSFGEGATVFFGAGGAVTVVVEVEEGLFELFASVGRVAP